MTTPSIVFTFLLVVVKELSHASSKEKFSSLIKLADHMNCSPRREDSFDLDTGPARIVGTHLCSYYLNDQTLARTFAEGCCKLTN